MKKNNSLHAKLKSYSALAGSILAASSIADAQIIYNDTTDITYDTHQTGFTFDLNNDGITDYSLFLLKYTGTTLNNQVLGFGSNNVYQVAGQVGSSSYIYPDVLNADDPIGDNLTFHSYGSMFWIFAKHVETSYGSYNGGYWVGAEDKFVGLRLTLGTENFYGWLRLSVDTNSSSFTIKDFAYQSTPDSAILAGDRDSLVSVEPIALINQLSIFSNNKVLFINNSFPGESEMNVQLFDIAGRNRLSFITNQKQVKRELPQLPDGIYIVKVETSQGVQSKKIMIR